MNETKDIFDTNLVQKRRVRGRKLGIDPFLHHRCADDAIERILDINRTFTRTLLIANTDITTRIIAATGHKLGETYCVDTLDAVETQGFDLIFDGLNLHTINAVPQSLAKIKTLLKPDGLYIAALFGGETLSGLRHALYEVEDTLYGQVTPRISPMITLQQGAKLLQSTGFAMPVTDRDLVTINYSGLSALFTDLRKMGETNALVGRSKRPVTKRFFTELHSVYSRDHSTENGKLRVNFDILWLTGWAPHKDQPKPLKPGSAKARLADALGVPELNV